MRAVSWSALSIDDGACVKRKGNDEDANEDEVVYEEKRVSRQLDADIFFRSAPDQGWWWRGGDAA